MRKERGTESQSGGDGKRERNRGGGPGTLSSGGKALFSYLRKVPEFLVTPLTKSWKVAAILDFCGHFGFSYLTA